MIVVFQMTNIWLVHFSLRYLNGHLWYVLNFCRASLVAQRLKHLPAMWETWVRSLGREYPLEKEMATHSSILAWRIPWTEKPSRLQSTGSQRVGHDWATSPSPSPLKGLRALESLLIPGLARENTDISHWARKKGSPIINYNPLNSFYTETKLI